MKNTRRKKREKQKTRKVDKWKSAAASRAQTFIVYFLRKPTNAKNTMPPQKKMQRPRASSWKAVKRTPMVPPRLRAAAPIMWKRRYTCQTSVSCVFRAPCNLYPHPQFGWISATLSFLDFYIWFFVIFLFFIFTFTSKCRHHWYYHLFCPFICPTIARMSFRVQLVVCCNFKRLQRKCEYCVKCVLLRACHCLFG